MVSRRTRRTRRSRGGALGVEKLREHLNRVPSFRYVGNEASFNSKGFDEAKKWYDAAFHQGTDVATWKEALWPNHAQLEKSDVELAMILDEKTNKNEDSTGYWKVKEKVDDVVRFMDAFLRERMRKVNSDSFSFTRAFSPSERLEKLHRDAAAAETLLAALKGLSTLTGGFSSPQSLEGFHAPIHKLGQLIAAGKAKQAPPKKGFFNGGRRRSHRKVRM